MTDDEHCNAALVQLTDSILLVAKRAIIVELKATMDICTEVSRKNKAEGQHYAANQIWHRLHARMTELLEESGELSAANAAPDVPEVPAED